MKCPCCGQEADLHHKFVRVGDQILYEDRPIALVPHHRRLLWLLIEGMPHAVSKEEIIAAGGGGAGLTTVVSKLRYRLKDLKIPFEIFGLRNVGYLLQRKEETHASKASKYSKNLHS